MADAPDSKSGGKPWGFESLHQHHIGAKFGFAPIFFIEIRSLILSSIMSKLPYTRSRLQRFYAPKPNDVKTTQKNTSSFGQNDKSTGIDKKSPGRYNIFDN